tara:strand:- start:4639 stop:4758 length:120 start_codon:yes stop_codon:yes gene_type:complete
MMEAFTTTTTHIDHSFNLIDGARVSMFLVFFKTIKLIEG